jgi:hypothetical protein
VLNLTLERIERQIRNLPVEHVYVLGPENEIVFHHTDNAHNRVHIPTHAQPLLPHALVTHNHPGGRSFSPTDVLLARKMELRDIRVVTATRRFSITPPISGWISVPTAEFSSLITRERGLLVAHVRDQIAKQRLTNSMAESLFHHWLWGRVAELGVLRYRVDRW